MRILKIFYNSGLNLIESIPKESNRGVVVQCIQADTKWQQKKAWNSLIGFVHFKKKLTIIIISMAFLFYGSFG
jgi:hypothetical protein